MALTLERLLFDAAEPAEGPNVGAFIRGAGGDVLTSSTVGGKKALDVSIADGVNVEVDLDFADDSVTAHQGGSWEVSLDSATLAALETINAVQSGTWTVEIGATSLAALENITVSATDLDIRDLAFATDSVDVSGSEVSLDSATLAALENITVSATDLDIRDLVFATDKVDVSGSTVNASIAAPNTTVLASAITVANTATVLPASALANRKKIEIQNKDNNSIFIGGSGVTVSTGIEVSKGGVFTMDLGPSALIYAISAAGSAPVRVLEIS